MSRWTLKFTFESFSTLSYPERHPIVSSLSLAGVPQIGNPSRGFASYQNIGYWAPPQCVPDVPGVGHHAYNTGAVDRTAGMVHESLVQALSGFRD